MKKLSRVLPLAALALLLSFAFTSNPLGKGDPDFVKKAYMAGCAEIAAGNMAIQKAQDPKVLEFAKMMVADHSEANEKLKSLVSDFPTLDSLDTKHKAMKATLMTLTGAAFEKAYLKGQVADHHDAIALFQQESTSGQDNDLKAFATATLPKLKSHLEHVQALVQK